MGSRIIRIPDPSPHERVGVSRILDPAGTALMLAVSASVLVASLLIGSLSAVAGHGPGAMVERPGPAPTMPTPMPEAPPTSR